MVRQNPPRDKTEQAAPAPASHHNTSTSTVRPAFCATAHAGNNLAEELADAIGEASKKQPTADEHAKRVQVVSDRIKELGPEQVETAVRWWLGPGREENPAQFSRVTRYPDALAVKGGADRIEEALRFCSSEPDSPTAPTATPEQIFDVEFDAMRRSHLNYLRTLTNQPGADYFDQVAREFAAKHGIEKTGAAIEWIAREFRETPEVKAIAKPPSLFTLDLLQRGLAGATSQQSGLEQCPSSNAPQCRH